MGPHLASIVRITPIHKPWKGHLEGESPQLGDLLTIVANYLLAGMILPVVISNDLIISVKYVFRCPDQVLITSVTVL